MNGLKIMCNTNYNYNVPYDANEIASFFLKDESKSENKLMNTKKAFTYFKITEK